MIKETYLKQRAHTKWKLEGDGNTKYYHAYASARKRRNLIQHIKTDQHIWLKDTKDIEEFLIQRFKNMYVSKCNNQFTLGDVHCQKIEDSNWDNLTRNINDNDIWPGPQRIGSEKAPGPDGLNAHVYKKFGNNVSDYLVPLIKNFFKYNYLNPRINSTRIILIPKMKTLL